MKVGARFLFLMVAAQYSATLLSPNALAASSAEARITNIKILLIDLDPDDGIAPSIYFDGGTASAVLVDPLASSPDRPNPEVRRSDYGSVPVFLGGTSESFVLGGTTGLASTAADALVTRIFTTSGYGRAFVETSTRFASDFGWAGFSLSPNTSFTMSGDAFYSASSDGRSTGARYWENSSASVTLSLFATTADGSKPFDPTSVYSQDTVDRETRWGAPVAFQGAREMTVTIANPTDDVMHGSLIVYVVATAAVPVPEPEALAFVCICRCALGSLEGLPSQT